MCIRDRETIGGQLDRIQRTANAVAELDVLAALAQVAAENNYCRPVVDLSLIHISRQHRQ